MTTTPSRTTTELLKLLPGKRPDAVLKRLVMEGLVERTTGRGRGRGRGVEWLYPPGTAERIAAVVRYREAERIRSFPKLRWALWLDGNDRLWDTPRIGRAGKIGPCVRDDLAAAYPVALSAIARLRGNKRLEALDKKATDMAPYDRTLASLLIAAVFPDVGLELDVPLGANDQETNGTYIDQALGEGTTDLMKVEGIGLTRSRGAAAHDASKWEQALRSATRGQARLAERLWWWKMGSRMPYAPVEVAAWLHAMRTTMLNTRARDIGGPTEPALLERLAAPWR